MNKFELTIEMKRCYEERKIEELLNLISSESAKKLTLEEKNFVKEYLEIYSHEIKICDKCESFMIDGYVVCDEYYCSNECLYEEVGREEWKKLSAYLKDEDERTEEEEEWAEEYGDTDCYWTQWI